MSGITRREFLEFGRRMAVMMGLGAALGPQLAEAAEELTSGRPSVLWLQGLSCSGCSISLLNNEYPGPAGLLTRYLGLLFHSTLSAATGATAMDVVAKAVQAGGYYLVAEGAVPAGLPEACRMGHQTMGDLLTKAALKAKAVVAIGACAAHGGIPAAEGNPTGAMSVPEFLKKKGVTTPVIRLPGCPAHPDWLVGTIVHLIKFGPPALDDYGRPTMFYGRLVHDQCPRFADYEREYFAAAFGQPGCLFKLGCLGPLTHADCTLRKWNGGVNTCIMAGAPCIGCAGEFFAQSAALPFYRKAEARGGKGA